MQTFGKNHRARFDAPPDVDAVNDERSRALPDPGLPMLEALVCEVHSAALLTAAIASAVNAFRLHEGERSETGLKPYIPREPALISVLRNGMLENNIKGDTVAVVLDYFDALGPARIALDKYFADASDINIGADRAAALHLLSTTSAWRRASESARFAVRQLLTELGRLPAQYTSNSKMLIGLLQDVITGGTPCLDARGRLALPDLPQRRQSARRTICQPCTITHNRETSQAFVRDVAPGGFGLERVSQLMPKTLVQIELPSGRRFTGIVAWCNGSAAGVRFTKPLLPNDPLLSG